MEHFYLVLVLLVQLSMELISVKQIFDTLISVMYI